DEVINGANLHRPAARAWKSRLGEQQMKTNISGCFRTMQRLGAFWAPLFGLLLFGFPSGASSADDVTIATIRAACQSREGRLNRIPFRLEWAEKRMNSYRNRPAEYTEYKSVMIAKGKKLRYEWSRMGSKPLTMTIAWQGKSAKVLDATTKDGAI